MTPRMLVSLVFLLFLEGCGNAPVRHDSSGVEVSPARILSRDLEVPVPHELLRAPCRGCFPTMCTVLHCHEDHSLPHDRDCPFRPDEAMREILRRLRELEEEQIADDC